MVSALIGTDYMKQQCVGVVLRLLIEPDARLADGQLGDEVRCLE
jgi:hypothetical protein